MNDMNLKSKLISQGTDKFLAGTKMTTARQRMKQFINNVVENKLQVKLRVKLERNIISLGKSPLCLQMCGIRKH